jgi:hypothetical protein
MYVDILAFLIFAGVTWAVASEGTWGAVLVFVDVLFSALIATNFWQPLAGFLSAQAPEWRFWWQFVVLMLLFTISLALIRGVTGALSPRALHFPALADQALRWAFALCAAWVFVGFFYTSLHTAPLSREFLGFQAERKNFFGAAPDRHWLGFMHFTSRTALDRDAAHVFDPEGIFLPSYASWRESYENPDIIQGSITAEEFPEGGR